MASHQQLPHLALLPVAGAGRGGAGGGPGVRWWVWAGPVMLCSMASSADQPSTCHGAVPADKSIISLLQLSDTEVHAVMVFMVVRVGVRVGVKSS